MIEDEIIGFFITEPPGKPKDLRKNIKKKDGENGKQIYGGEH